MPFESFSPSETESAALDLISRTIADTREDRSNTIHEIISALADADEVTRLVAHIAIKSYLGDIDPLALFSKRSPLLGCVRYHAPGMFFAHGKIKNELLETGEFIGINNFYDSAESLGFNNTAGRVASDFLYQWVASKNPDSYSAEIVSEFSLPSGRMSHNMYSRGDFNSAGVLFHDSIMEEYAFLLRSGLSQPHSQLDAIIILAGTDDIELAGSFLSSTRRKKVGL